jgi:hypothetical protein
MTAAFSLPWGKQRCIMQSRELDNNFNKPDAAKHDRFHANRNIPLENESRSHFQMGKWEFAV